MDPLYITKIEIKQEIPKNNYLSQLSVVKNLNNIGGLTFNKPVTFLVGENGIGKSTLIEAMAVNYGFNPEGGTRNFNFDTRSTHSDLHQYIKLIKSYRTPKWGFFLRAESFYNVSTNIDQMDEAPGLSPPVIDSYGGVSLHKQSHGESFLAVVENGFSANGLYILDEPEAALSPNGIMRLISNIHNLVKQGSQFIISTHSPMLMAYPDAEIYEITKDDIQSVEYKQTNHYVITRQFLENPQKMLNYLLDDN